MVISRDEPGRSIVLHEESISFWRSGGCGILMLLPFWTAPVVFVLLLFLEPGASARAGGWIPLVILAGWLTIIGGATIAAIRKTRRLALLSADRSTGEWIMEEWAPLSFFARHDAFAIGEIERIELWTVREYGKPKGVHLPLRLRMDLRGRRFHEVPYKLDVHGLDRREEALDLALRFAHVVGLGFQRVAKNDHIEFRVVMTRTAEQGSSPTAPISGPAEYERDQVGVEGRLARDAVPPFDPVAFQSEYCIERWLPGREVLLTRLATPAQGCTNTLGCFAIFLFGAVIAWAVCISSDLPNFVPATATFVGLGLFVLAAREYRIHAMRGEVRIDWGSRLMTIDRYGTRIDFPLHNIQRVEVRGARSEHTGGKGETQYQTFRVQVYVRLWRARRDATGLELVVETNEARDDPVGPYRSGLALGVELAKALGVPHVYFDYQ